MDDQPPVQFDAPASVNAEPSPMTPVSTTYSQRSVVQAEPGPGPHPAAMFLAGLVAGLVVGLIIAYAIWHS